MDRKWWFVKIWIHCCCLNDGVWLLTAVFSNPSSSTPSSSQLCCSTKVRPSNYSLYFKLQLQAWFDWSGNLSCQCMICWGTQQLKLLNMLPQPITDNISSLILQVVLQVWAVINVGKDKTTFTTKREKKNIDIKCPSLHFTLNMYKMMEKHVYTGLISCWVYHFYCDYNRTGYWLYFFTHFLNLDLIHVVLAQ